MTGPAEQARRLARVQAAKRDRMQRSGQALGGEHGLALPPDAASGHGCAVTGAGRRPAVLFVCTGNVCRSPYFERVLAAQVGARVDVASAGTGALLIGRMASGAESLLRARGIDPGGFAPRQLTAEMVRAADLVLTATRLHRRLVVEEAPAAAGTVFALGDFAHLLVATGGDGAGPGIRGEMPGLPALVRAAAARQAGPQWRSRRRADAEIDVVDPFRQGPEVFDRMAAQADPSLGAVARAVLAAVS